MKYLKRYKEAVAVRLKSELKSTVEDLLIELRDDEFQTNVSEIDYHSQKERVKVNIKRDKEFTYEDIKLPIESIWSYLSGEGFEIEHFTCVEDENFEESEDEFTINQKIKGLHYTTDPKTFGTISIEKEFQRRPQIINSPVYDPINFARVDKWTFEISFTKDKISVDRKRSHLSTNEELSPETYIKFADYFNKRHPKKAEEFRKHSEELKRRQEELKRRQEESYKRSVLEEGKKLGEFNLFFEKRGQFKKANCYFQFLIGEYHYSDALNDWLNGNSDTLWLEIQIGIQPITEKDLETIEWSLGDEYSNWINKRNGIFWCQNAYIKVSKDSYKKVDDKVEIIPEGKSFHFEEYDFNIVKCSDRNGAEKFKKTIISLFHGDIEYKQANDKYFKDVLNEMLCENDEMSLSSSDYDNFIYSTYDIRLNKLYKTVNPDSILE